MNLLVFLKEVDGISAGLSHGELKAFIHELARKLPEEKRNYFINTLRSIEDLSEKAASQDIVKDEGYTELIQEVETIKEKLVEINKGAYCMILHTFLWMYIRYYMNSCFA